MIYKAIVDFTEPEHKNHIYRTGVVYPADGFKTSQKRIDYLLSDKTSFKAPVIKADEKPKDG